MARWAALILAAGIALAVNHHASGQQLIGVARTNPYFQRLVSSVVTASPALMMSHGPGHLGGLTAGLGPQGTPAWGTDILISNVADTSPQNEPTVSVNDANPLIVLAGANDYRSPVDASCGLYRSVNGGTSWADLGTLREEAGTIGIILEAAGDPAIAFDRQGYAYYGCLYFTRAGGGSKGSIFVHRSTTGGLTFSAPAPVAVAESPDTFHDKEHVATGPAPSRCGTATTCNNVYVSWTEFGLETAQIRFARSTNSGAGFSGAPKGPWITLSDSAANQGSNICTNSSGHVMVVWDDFVAAAPFTGRIRARKSATEGTAFGSIVTIANIYHTPSPLGNGANFRVNSFPVCSGDPTNANRWFVTWAARPTASSILPNIYFSASVDGGATWSTPQIVDNVATASFFPWMTTDAGGTIWILYGSRLNGSDATYHTRVAHRHFGTSTTWTNQQVINLASSGACQFSGLFIGDYFGIDYAGGGVSKILPAWTDTRDCVTRGQDIMGDRSTPAAPLLPTTP